MFPDLKKTEALNSLLAAESSRPITNTANRVKW